MTQPLFAGIDVSKARLDVALGDQFFSIKHTDETISELIEKFKAASPQLIVLEATGGLEGPLVAYLAAAKLPVVVVNPRQASLQKPTKSMHKPSHVLPRQLNRNSVL